MWHNRTLAIFHYHAIIKHGGMIVVSNFGYCGECEEPDCKIICGLKYKEAV